MYCTAGCNSVGPTSKIVVDGDADSSKQAPLQCFHGQACTLSQAPYYKLEEGTCCCPDGDLIKTQAECQLALESLYTGDNALIEWVGSDTVIPGGCSWRHHFHHGAGQGAGGGHWNEATAGTARFDQVPICKAPFGESTVSTTPKLFLSPTTTSV